MGTARKAHRARWRALRIKRVYEAPEAADGRRVLVDRLWPRGLSKQRAALHTWLRDLSPSDELRRKVHAAPDDGWDNFLKEYRKELGTEAAKAAIAQLEELLVEGPVTLLYAAKDEEHNNAVALKSILEG